MKYLDKLEYAIAELSSWHIINLYSVKYLFTKEALNDELFDLFINEATDCIRNLQRDENFNKFQTFFYYGTFRDFLDMLEFNFRSSFDNFDELNSYINELSNYYCNTFYLAIYTQKNDTKTGIIYVLDRNTCDLKKHNFRVRHTETTCVECVDDVEGYDEY